MPDNSDRAGWAQDAVDAFMASCGTDREDAVSDLIANLCHLSEADGVDAIAAVRRGLSHYYAETHHEQIAHVVVRFEQDGDRKLNVAEVAAALRSLTLEVMAAKRLKISANGVLDPLHPIVIMAENGVAVLNFIKDAGVRTGTFPIKTDEEDRRS